MKAGRAILALVLTVASGAALSQTAIPEIRAQLAPRDFTTLAAEIGAKVERLGAREGDRFRKGQSLVAFDCSIQRANLAEAQATLTAADKTVAVNKRLLELQSIGKLENDVAVAEAEKARAKVAAGNAVTSKCAITAPFDGRVVEQKVHAQQFVQAGQPLLDVLDDSVLELEFVVPSKWLVWLKPGTAFQAAIDETGKSYPAKVTRVGARIDPVSQSVKLTAEVGGHFPELAAGMSGRVLLAPPP
jgi:RND family efflux transporter MFP subunit